jgi:DnaJ-class molecular chaperone
MQFGKRFSVHNNRPAPVLEQNCQKCFGTGRVRERGTKILCRVCAGRGKVSKSAA